MRSPKKNCELNRAGFFQRAIRAVLVDRLQSARGDPHTNELSQLRHPDAVLVQIRGKNPGHILGDVTADPALFLGHTAPVNGAAARGS